MVLGCSYLASRTHRPHLAMLAMFPRDYGALHSSRRQHSHQLQSDKHPASRSSVSLYPLSSSIHTLCPLRNRHFSHRDRERERSRHDDHGPTSTCTELLENTSHSLPRTRASYPQAQHWMTPDLRPPTSDPPNRAGADIPRFTSSSPVTAKSSCQNYLCCNPVRLLDYSSERSSVYSGRVGWEINY
jgi:hypothetical protein